ncbi:MAG TPA: hypothetical protein VH087_01900 [Thermoanaerobaculia bacterium]|nr:hypothetical protein [Thermoanaerobaculia bacterium]
MNNAAKWFQRILRITVWIDFIFGLLAIFLPNTMLRLFGQKPSSDVLWTAFAGLMLLVFALMVCPAASDMNRYKATAFYAVVCRALMAFFFLFLWPGYLFFAIWDLVIFIVLAWLLYAASKVPTPEWEAEPSAS